MTLDKAVELFAVGDVKTRGPVLVLLLLARLSSNCGGPSSFMEERRHPSPPDFLNRFMGAEPHAPSQPIKVAGPSIASACLAKGFELPGTRRTPLVSASCSRSPSHR